MNLVEQEKILLQVIEEMKQLSKFINENTEKKIQTILLIGNTGAGKSTIFNWLNGAKFQYEKIQNTFKFELKVVEEKGKTYAAQGSSTQSVTYLPNFYFLQEYNHLIVDFPGFNDTHGPSKQLTIKLMFNEIITKSDVKLVVVTSSSTSNLPNRGVSLRELITNNLQQKNSSYQSIGLIINNYNDPNNLPDQAKQSICMDLEDISNNCDLQSKEIFKALQKKIIIIKKVSKSNFNEVLSEESRNSLINQLIQIVPGKYQPDEIDESGFISDYISTQTEQIITEQKAKFQEQLLESKKELEGKGNAFVTKLNAFIEGIKKIDYEKVNSILEFLKSMNSTSVQNQNFQIIFQYFYQYKEQIKFFKNINQIIQDLKEIAEKFVKELQIEIDKIKKEQEKLEQIKKEALEKAQQNYEKEREQYKNQMMIEKLQTFQQLNRELQIENKKIQEDNSKLNEQMLEKMMKMMEVQSQKSDTPQEESKKQEKETKKESVNQQDLELAKKQLEQQQKAMENENQIKEYKKQLAEQTSIKIKAEEDRKAFQAKFKFYESYSELDKQKIADYEEKIINAKIKIGYYEVLLQK